MSEHFSIKRLAAKWSVSERTLRRLIEAGELTAVNVSSRPGRRSLRIRQEDVERFDLRRQVGTKTVRQSRCARPAVSGREWY